jgi:hypothetical protein
MQRKDENNSDQSQNNYIQYKGEDNLLTRI